LAAILRYAPEKPRSPKKVLHGSLVITPWWDLLAAGSCVGQALGGGKPAVRQSSNSMLYRIGILLLVLIGLGLLWPSKARAVLGLAGIIAALAAIGVLIVVLINLPASQ
jgi:hypothetical protein